MHTQEGIDDVEDEDPDDVEDIVDLTQHETLEYDSDSSQRTDIDLTQNSSNCTQVERLTELDDGMDTHTPTHTHTHTQRHTHRQTGKQTHIHTHTETDTLHMLDKYGRM